MANVYVKRGSIVEAEPFDPARDDQGVDVLRAEDGTFLSARLRTGAGRMRVLEGDWIVTLPSGPYPFPARNFTDMYEPVNDVLEQIPVPPVEGVPA